MEEKLYKIVVDTKGGDKGPSVILDGVAEALALHPSLAVLLVGDETALREACLTRGLPMARVELLDAPGEITNYDSPVAALFEKADASLVRGMRALAERKDLCGFLGTGSTGALLAASLRFLSERGSGRPALGALIPTESGGFTCLVDTGATIDCDAKTLHHFAHLGTDFMRKMYGIASPRVALLSNGAEETKGNRVTKEAYSILAADAALNFVGNVEGSRAFADSCDVLVCDGFAGNQVLKVTEGTARRLLTDVGRFAKKTGSADVMALLSHLMQIYDIPSLGGGNVLGVRKPVVKAHGASDAKAIVSTLGMLLNMAANRAVFDGEYVKNLIGGLSE